MDASSFKKWMKDNSLTLKPHEVVKAANDLFERYFCLLISQKVIFHHQYCQVGFIKVCTHLEKVFPSLPLPSPGIVPTCLTLTKMSRSRSSSSPRRVPSHIGVILRDGHGFAQFFSSISDSEDTSVHWEQKLETFQTIQSLLMTYAEIGGGELEVKIQSVFMLQKYILVHYLPLFPPLVPPFNNC